MAVLADLVGFDFTGAGALTAFFVDDFLPAALAAGAFLAVAAFFEEAAFFDDPDFFTLAGGGTGAVAGGAGGTSRLPDTIARN